jgi:exopolysaccharide biosynthesis polyprenyl glycosylphosphotransferase
MIQLRSIRRETAFAARHHQIPEALGLHALTPGRPRRYRRATRLFAVDLAMSVLGTAVSAFGATQAGVPMPASGWIALNAALALALVAARGGYRFRLRLSPFDQVGRIVAGTSVATMLVVATRVLVAPDADAAAESVRLWGFLTVYLAAGRVAFAIADSRSPGLNTLVLGAGEVGRRVARRLNERPELGLRPVGFVDGDPPEGHTCEDPPVLGASWDIEEIARRHAVEHVILAFPRAPHGVLLGVLRQCRALGIEVSLVPRLFEEVSRQLTVEHLGGIALLRAERADPRGLQFEVKYAFDRVVSAIGVLVLLPVLAAVALLVKLSSPGPLFFRQERIGRDGVEFDILKFRTLRVVAGAPEQDAAWAFRELGLGDGLSAEPPDPDARRTPIGTFLRRYSLDELPQLLNVLKGDMSLVGPRPERTDYVRAFESTIYRYGDRHRVKSGLTGWAQVHGLRGETSLQERVEWDNYYVENWSPMLDLKILLLTLPAILAGGYEGPSSPFPPAGDGLESQELEGTDALPASAGVGAGSVAR